jgi:DNA-binding response OmpR family regulator
MEAFFNKRVIVIEDNQLLASVIVKKLESLGAHVQHYTNGLEGLAAIRSSAPHLVLLDILFPIMNGYEVLQVMHAEGLTVRYPVLVISNSGQPVELSRMRELGARDYLIKANFSPDEVVTKARELILPEAHTDTLTQVMKTTPAEQVTAPKVLIVEDDPMLRNLLSMKLTRHNYPFMFVSDGVEAIDSARTFEPNVIILDLMLPGKNGFEVFSELKGIPELASIPVIIFSNKSDDKDRARATELGAAKYLIKAMTDLNELMAIIASLAHAQRARA